MNSPKVPKCNLNMNQNRKPVNRSLGNQHRNNNDRGINREFRFVFLLQVHSDWQRISYSCGPLPAPHKPLPVTGLAVLVGHQHQNTGMPLLVSQLGTQVRRASVAVPGAAKDVNDNS